MSNQNSIFDTVIKNLFMGGTAGIIGASCTYPMDMVKTKLQFQRTAQYSGIVDCFKKIIAANGVRGLYRGLPAQLIGIAPEKAIKLTVNDTLRLIFANKQNGKLHLWQEALAGAIAGTSQVVITGPYELVKVRLQTEGGHHSKGIISIVRELGFRGMFTGSGATLLRDVPFSAIYFSLYSRTKLALKDKDGNLPLPRLFAAGISAGATAAYLATPADVIKTRIQAKGEGAAKYNGIRDCATRILKEEGVTAFFKGSIPRVLIVAPLFGITLSVYEILQGFFLDPSQRK
eukprot:TRINITY_DN1179_c0_g2_i1.p1 TRINITY_DN1179_c0_g2~~TRINITY_DN1179_c0_g2_i1.p1  ORF type:complete len:288 (-),score=121.96 TRINITY_DN1179_c0_g2_i1:181-1044(-)